MMRKIFAHSGEMSRRDNVRRDNVGTPEGIGSRHAEYFPVLSEADVAIFRDIGFNKEIG